MARPTLNENPKFRLLCRRLSMPRPHARGHLEMLWDCAHATGNPVIGSPEEVEAAAEWAGADGELFAALRDGRWIDGTEDGTWAIHDYFDHAPRYVRDRAAREAARVAKGRTLSEMRAEAGRRGAAVTSGKRAANGDHLQNSGGKRSANGEQPSANGSTPSPSPKESVAATPQTAPPRRPAKSKKPPSESKLPPELIQEWERHQVGRVRVTAKLRGILSHLHDSCGRDLDLGKRAIAGFFDSPTDGPTVPIYLKNSGHSPEAFSKTEALWIERARKNGNATSFYSDLEGTDARA